MTAQRDKTPKAKAASQHTKYKKPSSLNADSVCAQAKRARRRKSSVKPATTGKVGIIVDLLKKPKGASAADLCAATGWQSQSVRGVLSGTIKKKLGLQLLSEKTNKGRIYRIVE